MAVGRLKAGARLEAARAQIAGIAEPDPELSKHYGADRREGGHLERAK
ncbi:MAG: hypothetical protein ABSC21_19255 [Terriglobia bacterium]|jgi:hypothetical protein